MTLELKHFGLVEPRDNPDFRVAGESLFEHGVSRKDAVVQVQVLRMVFNAGSPANVHVKHVLQAIHNLYKGSLDEGFLEQEDIIGAVVEHFHADSGCFEHTGVSGFHYLWKSNSYVRIMELLTGIWKRGEKEKKE